MERPFITSIAQWAGTVTRSPCLMRSSKESVQSVASSSNRQGSVAEGLQLGRNPSILTALGDQILDVKPAESNALSGSANMLNSFRHAAPGSRHRLLLFN
jgi:hypothetical protein